MGQHTVSRMKTQAATKRKKPTTTPITMPAMVPPLRELSLPPPSDTPLLLLLDETVDETDDAGREEDEEEEDEEVDMAAELVADELVLELATLLELLEDGAWFAAVDEDED